MRAKALTKRTVKMNNHALQYPDYTGIQDENMSDKRPDYDRITFDVPKGMQKEIKRLVQDKTGLSLASYLRQLVANDLGLEFDMKSQIADNTSKRRKTG